MTEETAGAEVPVTESNALAVEQDANVSAPSTEQHSEAVTEGEAAPAEQTGDDAKVPEGVQKRIDELTRKRREAERRAERAERELAQTRGRDLSDMDWEDQIAEKTFGRSQEAQIRNDRQAAQELAAEAYNARVEVVAAIYPDYQAVVSNPNLQITPAMAEAILDSEYGPQVAYHLGKNPNEAARIATLNPVSQARELGRLEALVSAPRQVKQPAAAPVNPVGGRAAATQKDPSKMTMAEYAAWRQAG